MTTKIHVPDLGDDVHTAVVARWLAAPGDAVEAGQVVAELVADKAELAVATPADGRLERRHAEEHAAVAPGDVLATIGPTEAETPRPAPTRSLPTADAVASYPTSGGAGSVTRPLSRMRKVIAQTMMTSLQTTAQLTAIREVDVTRIMALRAQAKDAFRERYGVPLSPLAFLTRAACIALGNHPALNATIDMDAGTATYHGAIDLGMAVDTPRGLVVVRVPDAGNLTVGGLARAVAALAGRAREGRLGPHDTGRSTFTVTNTGSGGTTAGTPILNPPQVGILGTYAIERRPAVVTDATGQEVFAARWRCNLALTYDHRMLDGADAARYLADVKGLVEGHDFSGEI